MDQIFKLFEVFMSLTTAKSQTLSKQVLGTIRKLLIVVVASLGAMALFCVGVSVAIFDLAKQLEMNSGVVFTGPFKVGCSLAFISLGIFIYCLSQKAWLEAAAMKEENKPKGPSPIEEALAVLIKDIVVERQTKRQAEDLIPKT